MEEDLKLLESIKGLTPKSIKLAIKESLKNKKISYIPYLIEITYKLPNLDNKTTYEIIEFLNLLFYSPQEFQIQIEEIGKTLLKRKDLFYCFLIFCKGKKFKDDSYYWYPDLKYTDTFSFICGLFEDIGQCLVYFVGKEYILKKEIDWNLMENFYCAINTTTQLQLQIIKKDLEFLNPFSVIKPKTNIPSEEIIYYQTIISHAYWTEGHCDCFEFFEIEAPVDKNKKYVLCSCFSLIEVEFGTSITVLVNLKCFEGLLLKKEEVKRFWVNLGIIDESWECIIK